MHKFKKKVKLMLFQTFVEHKQRYFEECGCFIDAILIGV